MGQADRDNACFCFEAYGQLKKGLKKGVKKKGVKKKRPCPTSESS
jgi:hypothetical protein